MSYVMGPESNAVDAFPMGEDNGLEAPVLRLRFVDDQQVGLEWTAVVGAEGYIVQRWQYTGGQEVPDSYHDVGVRLNFDDNTGTNPDHAPVNGNQYRYRVRAYRTAP